MIVARSLRLCEPPTIDGFIELAEIQIAPEAGFEFGLESWLLGRSGAISLRVGPHSD